MTVLVTSALADLVAQVGPVEVGSSGASAELWVFWVMAPVALGAALSMVLLRNAVHAALMLVVNFFAIAVLYATLEAQFLAVVQIIVYAGAVMVLVLFVLMLLGVHREEDWQERLRVQRPLAVLLGLALLVALVVGVAGPFMGGGSACGAGQAQTAPGQTVEQREEGLPCAGLAGANAEGNVKGVGLLLFTRYVWPFEVLSALLVVAAIGAIILGRRHEPPEDLVDQPAKMATPVARTTTPGDADAGGDGE